MLGEKAFFTTINQVVMRNLQTYGMTVKTNHKIDACVKSSLLQKNIITYCKLSYLYGFSC